MDLQTEKLILIERISQIQDVETITQVKQVLGLNNDPIVGYEIDGKPIIKSELTRSLRKARERYKKGQFITQEELEKEIETW